MNEKARENVIAFNAAARRGGQQAAPFQILGRCRNLASRHVEPLLKEMLDGADDALFRLAEKAEDNRSQTTFFDAMRALRRQRSTMESEYVTQIARVFDACMRPGPGGWKTAPASTDELSLVASDELEENLAIEGMVAKVRRISEAELHAVRRRLGAVMDRPGLGEDDNPLDPKAFCHAFRDAMHVLDVDIRIRLIIYKLFDQFVIGHLPPLYQEVNRYLQEMGILPDLRPEGRFSAPAATGGTARDEAAERGGWSAPAQEPAGGTSGEEGDLLLLLERLARGGGGYPSATGHHPGGTAVGRPVSGPGTAITTADAGALLSALSAIPLNQLAVEGRTVPVADLKGAVITALNPDGGQAVAINRTDESAIDIVSMLFEFVFDDPALPAPIKELIGRLQIPLLKVAILDKSFFSRKRHPARRLLSELSRAGVGWSESSDEGGELRARIESVVERLLDEFEDDVGLFEEVLADFQSFCASQAERAGRREEETAQVAQGREQLLVAKAVAGEAIEHVLDGQSLPPAVHRLLEGTWKDLLVLIHLRHGEHGPLWQKALNVASLLVWSLIPKQGEEEREQLTRLLPSLLKSLQEGMNRMSLPQAEQQEILGMLAAEHTRMVKEKMSGGSASTVPVVSGEASAEIVAESSPVTADPVPTDGRSFMARKVAEINQRIAEGCFQVFPDESPAGGDAESATVDDLHLLTARELSEGTWLEIEDEELGKTRRMKLSWKSLISGKYFFVNQQGLKVREMTVHALAAEFRAGRARVIEDVPVFDRAISRLMAQLKENPG
ncbi:DUF1631 domain-containing protein [Ectothiorhodospira shaposhnikovii]|uniref:DUF1631 domain-containing protein n=1 Tax=Ectothiorhodospira shaposhnikovii TaxID=1054 RepID=UPI001EE98481|nr:DUF1631 domain-containing protein [Ectothiorhodospira shaposhnikovii]MCG5511559.1 DUF1631 domain-containing protein [Ectothiorhodospira shaposhnikovii]